MQNSFFFNTNLTMQEKVKHRRRESEKKCVLSGGNGSSVLLAFVSQIL